VHDELRTSERLLSGSSSSRVRVRVRVDVVEPGDDGVGDVDPGVIEEEGRSSAGDAPDCGA
jgi:hypothetical protein